MTVVSVIICTRNRAASLKKTLAALSRVTVPNDLKAELFVVDNGSTDQTPSLLAAAGEQLGELELNVLSEPRPGKSWALNRALAASTGSVVLFTDDDVLPPPNWIEAMCAPIMIDQADAVAGGLRHGPVIVALGLQPEQRSWLATTEFCQRPYDAPLVGANMAIARRVFDTIPWFDPEVGPGAIGHAEDTLFWLQVRAAGFRIISRYDIVAEHNPDPSRATRHAFMQLAEKHGEFAAYVDYHWNRIERRHPYLALTHATAKLWLARLNRLPQWLRAQDLPAWEMELLEIYHLRRRLLHERRRPPNYDRNGLVKLRGVPPAIQNPVAVKQKAVVPAGA